ncbi:MAG: ferredoxin [Paracoccaceae bacterium]
MDYDALRHLALTAALDIFGGFHPTPADDAPTDTETLLLLGPHEPGFWPHVSAAPEISDGLPNPLDRWSARIIAGLADKAGGRALFPFGGPPYQPFIAWALRSGRAWTSPVGLLVHDRAGLFVSYRGALALPYHVDLPRPPPKPCDTCSGQPCRNACPVSALTDAGYDLDRCHAYLDTNRGKDCMAQGCAVRRACPVSAAYGRLAEQSAFHMKAFHP